MMLQSVTYWRSTGTGAEGEVYAAPVTFLGRWEEVAEAFLTPVGEETVSNAIVYCDREIVVGSYLLRGTSVGADPTVVDGACKVRQRVTVPDLRNITSEYRAIL